MTEYKVTVDNQEHHIVEADAQVQVVKAQEAGLLSVVAESVSTVAAAVLASPVIQVTQALHKVVASRPQVTIQAGGGVGLTVNQSSGSDTFLALIDTPSSYSGSAGYLVRVNALASGLEFFDGGLASIVSRLGALESAVTVVEGSLVEIGIAVDGHTSTLSAHTASILEMEADISTNADGISAHASLLASVEASITSIEGDIDANAVAILGLDVRVDATESSISSHAAAILGVAADVTSLEEGFAGHADAILQLQSDLTALDGDVDVYAGIVLGVEALYTSLANNVSGNAASLVALNATVASHGDSIAANAQSIIDLGVALDAAEVNISANASEISTVDAKIDTHTGSATAHASIVQALQVSITNAQTGVTNNASAIVSLETDVSDIKGDVYAAYTVTLDVDGKITGIELIGGGSSSEFNIRADKFALYTSSAALSISGDADGNIEVAASKYIKFTGHASTPAKLYFVYGSDAASRMGQYANALTISGELVGGAYCNFYILDFTDVLIRGRDNVSLQSQDTAEDGTASAYIGCGSSYIRITSKYGSGTSGALAFGVTAYNQSTVFAYYKYLNSAYRIYPSNNDAQYLGDASYAWKGLYLSSNIRFTGSTGSIYVDAVTSGDSYLRLIGTTTTTGDYFYVMAYTDDSNTAAVIRALYGDYYIQIYHNGTDAIVLGKQGLLRFYANQASAGYLNSSGDLYLGGAVYESKWSLDKQYVDEKKWAMLQSIVAAYESHDGGKLDPALRKTHEGLGIQLDEHNKPMPGTGKATVGRSNSDLIQVATACIAELLQRVEALEKAA